MAYKLLDSLIDQYAKSIGLAVSQESSEIDSITLAKEKLKEKIISEVLQENHEEYTEIIKKELVAERERTQLESIKTFIIDGLFLAFLVGIIVNQSTDLITWIKTQTNVSAFCLSVTFVLILFFLLIILFSIHYRYISKITDFMQERSNGLHQKNKN